MATSHFTRHDQDLWQHLLLGPQAALHCCPSLARHYNSDSARPTPDWLLLGLNFLQAWAARLVIIVVFRVHNWVRLLISSPPIVYIAPPNSKKASQQGGIYIRADFFMACTDIVSVRCPLLSVYTPIFVPFLPLYHLSMEYFLVLM